MAQSEETAVIAMIKEALEQSPYACSSLIRMTAGTTNFVFRGTLVQPITSPNGLNSTVIIKHSKCHVPGNKDFPLDTSRCLVEESMLDALHTFPAGAMGVTTPHLYLFDRDTNIMVIADLPNALDLKSIMTSPAVNTTINLTVASTIGHHLGTWLRAFHTWGSEPAQIRLLNEVNQNKSMRDLKYKISYGTFIEVLQEFPGILGDDAMQLEAVREWAAKEFEKNLADKDQQGWGLIHGDFWTGNVLLPTTSSSRVLSSETLKMFIVDWEFAQFGNWSYDLGQMIGDIYEREHFHNIDHAVPMIRAFVEGYGGLSGDMAYRTAIHAGVQLLGWYKRRAPGSPLFGTQRQIEAAVVMGKEFVLRGWQRDRVWFETSPLAALFT